MGTADIEMPSFDTWASLTVFVESESSTEPRFSAGHRRPWTSLRKTPVRWRSRGQQTYNCRHLRPPAHRRTVDCKLGCRFWALTFCSSAPGKASCLVLPAIAYALQGHCQYFRRIPNFLRIALSDVQFVLSNLMDRNHSGLSSHCKHPFILACAID